jgi:hypothetical protein
MGIGSLTSFPASFTSNAGIFDGGIYPTTLPFGTWFKITHSISTAKPLCGTLIAAFVGMRIMNIDPSATI